MNMTKISIACKTDVGNKRPNNEDEVGYLNKPNFKVILVADGMGGHASGEIASKMAKEMILQLLDLNDGFKSNHDIKSSVKKVMKKTNKTIHDLSSSNDIYYGMGTTVVMAIVTDFTTAIINCGDSRCYLYKDDKLTQITTDQTVVEYLYQIGAISKEEMKTSPKRHVLMNAMGIAPNIDYDIKFIDNNYQGLMVCSDGLTNMVDDITLQTMWNQRKEVDTSSICSSFVDQALVNGGIDNISVCILEVK